MSRELTMSELKVVSHSLGINLYHSALCDNRKDKDLPHKYYRNYFAGNNEHLDNLVADGLAETREQFTDKVYHISDLGIKQFERQYHEMVRYVPVKNRDLNYLKRKVEFYSNWNYYTYSDPFGHAIESFISNVIERHYISHTSKDLVNTFKAEFKKEYKKGTLTAYLDKVKQPKTGNDGN